MSDETVRENGNETIRETQNSDATVREGKQAANFGNISADSQFRDYLVVRQLPSTSTEADIFVVQKADTEYILKLYRFGIEPKREILQSIKSLSERYPHNFIRVFETDFDAASGRWFEIQEYAKFGTLQAVIDEKSKLDSAQQNTFFTDVATQIGESLNLLHENNLLHLDIKPSNILLRSLKPLDMVLIDFGIATSLASDMSKKFTQTRGTPMYQSPESYTGGMGRPSDWWGLGMILLEIANGAHPFRGLSSNVIAYAIATEPIDIPQNLDEGQRELFHGLLTRNPEKRWDWKQLSRWLKGERGIPQYFEEASAVQGMITKPFAFMGQKCNSLAEIASAFVQSEEAWEKGRNFLMRGNIRQWLENNSEFEQAEAFEQELNQLASDDADEKMFYFTQKYGENIPLIFGGKLLTLNNLYIFAGKAVKRENVTPTEQKIVAMLTSGRLLEILRSYAKIDNDSDSKVLWLALETLRAKSSELSEIAGFLNFYLNPQKFFCPFVKDMSSTEAIIESSQELRELPIRLEDFRAVSDEYIIPKDLLDGMENATTYHSSLKTLDEMKNKNHLISRQKISQAEKSDIECLLSASMDEYMVGVYKWQWGYDEASLEAINSSLEKFKRQVRSASETEKAQLELWIAYLEFLLERENSLSHEDKLMLKNISLKETETLAKSISIKNIETLHLALQHYERIKSKYLEKFLEFCVNGSTQKVIDAINIGADVNVKDTGGDTALMRAARYGHVEIVKVLLNAGADVNAKSSRGSALMFAAEYGHVDIVNILINAGADVNVKDVYGETALIRAAQRYAHKYDHHVGHIEIVNMLINAGADVNAKERYGRTVLDALIHDSDGDIHHTKIFGVLLKAGAYFNIRDYTGLDFVGVSHVDSRLERILIEAARNNDIETVSMLLKAGVYTTYFRSLEGKFEYYFKYCYEYEKSFSDTESDRYQKAESHSHEIATGRKIAEVFFKAGANVNELASSYYVETWLKIIRKDIVGNHTERHCRKDIVKKLLEAASKGKTEVVKSLLCYGFDVNAKLTLFGPTAIMLAAESGNAETVNVLLDAGAKVKKKVLSYARENKMLQGTDALERLEQLCK